MYPPSQSQSRPLAIGTMVLLAAMVAGCGSGAADSTTPSPTASSTVSDPASASGAESTAPGASADAGATALNAAAERLADVTSYRFSVRFSGQSAGATDSQAVTMEGTVVTEPERALEFSVRDEAGGGSSSLRYVVIGDEAWMDLGDGGVVPFAVDDADTLFEAYSPQSLFGQSYVGYVDGMKAVGSEEKNGVGTTHYAADESTLGAVAAVYGGAAASWNMDVWVASNGGYLVSAVMGGDVSGADGGSYEVSIDVFDIDSPSNVVTPPIP